MVAISCVGPYKVVHQVHAKPSKKAAVMVLTGPSYDPTRHYKRPTVIGKAAPYSPIKWGLPVLKVAAPAHRISKAADSQKSIPKTINIERDFMVHVFG